MTLVNLLFPHYLLLAIQAPIFLFVLIVNLTSTVGIIELFPVFYKWSYATPMYNAVSASKSVLFGGYNRTSMNIGLLFFWLLTFAIIYIILQLKMHPSSPSERFSGGDDNVSMNSSYLHRRSAAINELEKSISGSVRRSAFSIRDSGMNHTSPSREAETAVPSIPAIPPSIISVASGRPRSPDVTLQQQEAENQQHHHRHSPSLERFNKEVA